MSNLVLKTTVQRNAAGTELYIEFLTATGVYESPDNEGGFGTPNPARNTLAIIFYGLHKGVEADVEVLPLAHDPLTVSSFTIALTKEINGHLNYYLWALPVFDSGGSYSDGDIVYDNETPSAPFIKKRVSGVWESITKESLINESDVDYKEGNSFPIPDAETFRNELNAQRLDQLRDMVYQKCPAEEYEAIRNNFDYVDAELEEAINDFCSGAYAEAQRKLEKIFEFQTYLEEAA